MNTFAPLWSAAVDSSIWDEPDFVFKVFMTMLAIKDADHIVRCNAYQLARKSRKTEGEVLEALKILAAPDKRRIEPQEFDGRRIKAVEDGWLVLNGEKYRKKISDEAKKARNRRAQQRWRDRQKEKRNATSAAYDAGEKRFEEAIERGDDAAADRIAAEPSERREAIESTRCTGCGLIGSHEAWCDQQPKET